MKRLPENTNLKLLQEELYKGLKVNHNHGYLIENYLDRMYECVTASLNRYSRTLMIRFDLRQFNCPWGDNDALISKFFKALNDEIRWDQENKQRQGKRVHPCELRYCWVKEQPDVNRPPHYHVAIFLNKDAYHKLGKFNTAAETMRLRIEMSWARALECDIFDIRGLVHFPQNAIYELNRNSPDYFNQFGKAFFRLSYFAKAATKRYRDGTRWFGCSSK
ncbi:MULTISPECIES: inovirus Gp2 family protein [Idiomarina]|jgi:hypothetical protein|uniref:inovirus Gp2 family protein n=1 Tax=Idiomarina TaxID=135575 RepID=UPI000C5A605A|nr:MULTISPECIES: inovirus Gp2 family protein [Idiomarina]MAO66807.1 transposase [Idiomarina sp.]MBF79956.1 transposase [Idiomarina sp.]MDV6326877.1 inovirus Gp2 family protein [Idiomarina sp. Sol25]|tara:strand:+ start:2352 stop:3008 length:657 start_codon:yes stop_codon:yes gene_type:complete